MAPLQVEQSMVQEKIQGKQAERARVIGLVRKALISDAEAEKELTQLQDEIQALESRYKSLDERQDRTQELRARLGDTSDLLHALSKRVDNASDSTKRALMKTLVAGIRVETVNGGPKVKGQRGDKHAVPHVTYVFESEEERAKCISSVASARPQAPMLIHPELALHKVMHLGV